MSRVSVAAMAFALALPDPCHAVRGEARTEAPPPSSPALVAPPTAPPVWAPPEPAPVAVSAEVDAGRLPVSPEAKRAAAAFEKGEHKKVRALLEKKARAGKATPAEARLVSLSCAALADRACVEALRPFVPQEAP